MTKNLYLEGLRGLAAIWVFALHFFMWESFSHAGKLINDYASVFLMSLVPGHLGVLYFFILSGYVIGSVYLCDRDLPLGQYLIKRWVRIYPLYAIVVLLSGLVEPSSIGQVIGHLLMLNPDLVPPLQGNPVLWSISYECWFYIFFPLIFAIPFVRERKGIPVLVGALSIGLLRHLLPIPAEFLIVFKWNDGLIFWTIGLVLAWTRSTPARAGSVDSRTLWSSLLMSMALSPCGAAIVAILKAAGISGEVIGSITPSIGDLIYVPTILVAFVCMIGVGLPKYFKHGIFYSQAMLVGGILLAAIVTHKLWSVPSYPASLCLFCLALVVKHSDRARFDLEALAPIGTISYGIYIIHMPIMMAIGNIPTLVGGWIEWGMRAIVSIVATLAIAYGLEIKLQPQLKKYFMGRFTKSIA